jgi:spermidine synthase
MLEIVVFVCGASLMILELVGSRILAPYLGTSIVVWTSLIGIILGSLSFGYSIGGKIADKDPNYRSFSRLIFFQGVCVLLTALIQPIFLALLQPLAAYNLYAVSILATTILFAPASVFAGMISPYATRLKMKNVNTSGTTIGNLYAISTLGSIAGTFLGGFFLITYLGSKNILLLISVVLCIAALSIGTYGKKTIGGIIIGLLIITIGIHNLYEQKTLIDRDTVYNRVWIYLAHDNATHKDFRMMQINEDKSSGMFLLNQDLVFPITKYYRLDTHFVPAIHTALMIGGGGYSYPKEFMHRFSKAHMDVIEIDPTVTELAKTYFSLTSMPRLVSYNEDARTYLNNSHKTYDVIFGDAFKAQSPPYNLTTKEVIQEYFHALAPQGAMLVNIIASIDGNKGKFLRAEYATFKSIFPQVYIFPIEKPNDSMAVQNILLVALKSTKQPSFTDANRELNKYLSHRWKKTIPKDTTILTDDFAPVEQYNFGL